MRIKIVIFIVLLSSLLWAESMISMQEAVEAALANNDDLISAGYDVKSANWDKYSALSCFLPTASFSMSRLQLDPAPIGYDGVEMDDIQSTNTLQIVQPILTGGKRILGYFITKRLEQISENQYNTTELDTRSNAELKYLSLLESYNLLNLAEDDLETMQTALMIAEVKFGSGILAEAEWLQIQSETAAKEADLAAAETYYQIASADLASFCDLEDRLLIPEVSEYDKAIDAIMGDVDPDLLLPALKKICREHNLTLQTLEESIELGKLNKMMAVSDNLPSVSLIYEKSWEDDFDTDSDKDASSSLMLTASIPVLPFVNTYCDYQKEHYQFKKAQRDHSSAEKGLYLQLSSAVLGLKGGVTKLKSSELALQYAEQTYLQMEERFRNNLISTTDLLSISLLRQSSEIAVLQDQISLIRYKAELKKLLNLKSDSELINILINI